MDGYEQESYDVFMNPPPTATQTQLMATAGLGAAADSLPGLCADFPAFRIWREIIGDRIQYVARRRHADAHPHTVVTTDPAKLRAALADGPPGMRRTPAGRGPVNPSGCPGTGC